ncbi:MAG: hypothetical protein ACTSRN_03525, partial [Alphaproteobacteria bacterium]
MVKDGQVCNAFTSVLERGRRLGMTSFFRCKKYEIPDSWAVCHMGNERRAIIRINKPLRDFAHKADFGVSIIFAVPLSDFDAESDISIVFEDTLFEQLQDSGHGIVVAVVTN